MKAKYVNNIIDEKSIPLKETDYLFVKRSTIPQSGMGLFTNIDIDKDEIIAVYKGDIITYEEAIKREKTKGGEYFIDLPNDMIMDSKPVNCFAKYANDAEGLYNTSKKNNAEIRLDNKQRPIIVATKNIKRGTEIFVSYGKFYWEKFEENLDKYGLTDES